MTSVAGLDVGRLRFVMEAKGEFVGVRVGFHRFEYGPVVIRGGVIDPEVTYFGEGEDRNVGPHLGFQGIIGARNWCELTGGDCESSETAFHWCHAPDHPTASGGLGALRPSGCCPNGKQDTGDYKQADNDRRQRGHFDHGKSSVHARVFSELARYLISALRPTFAASHGDVPHALTPSAATLGPRIKELLRRSNDFGIPISAAPAPAIRPCTPNGPDFPNRGGFRGEGSSPVALPPPTLRHSSPPYPIVRIYRKATEEFRDVALILRASCSFSPWVRRMHFARGEHMAGKLKPFDVKRKLRPG